MLPRDLNKVAVCSITERAEISFALANLVDEVTRLAFNVKRIVAVPDAQGIGSEHARRSALESPILQANSYIIGGEPVEMGDAANFPLSPRPVEPPPIESKKESCQAENVIAARVAELRDRLGGFIRSPRQQSDLD